MIMNNFPINLSYKGGHWPARLIKRAVLSTGYVVYCFERKTDKPCIGFNSFVVSVKSPLDHTAEWCTFPKSSLAIRYYLDLLCCYA